MAVNRDEFLRQLGELDLLSADELRDLSGGNRSESTDQLAEDLVARKRLTAFQAEQLKAGLGRSLSLGRNLLLEELGRGGMGVVYKAVHRTMKRTVALKVQLPAAVPNRDAVARFRREIEAAARLDHPNIVSIYDADESNGQHFYVMQYVEGRDLSKVVADEGPLPPAKAVEYVLQAARGMSYAHKKGIIHRDLKPVNLLRSTDGVIKVLDLGLARFLECAEADEGLTNTGAMLGTFDYMAPEQAGNSKAADARSDIYSLGMTLWFLMTGRRAYEGGNLLARLRAHMEQPIPSLVAHVSPSLAGTLVREIDDVFRRMAAKLPADRFQSMDDVVAALDRCLRHSPAAADPAPQESVVTVIQARASPAAAASTKNDASTLNADKPGSGRIAELQRRISPAGNPSFPQVRNAILDLAVLAAQGSPEAEAALVQAGDLIGQLSLDPKEREFLADYHCHTMAGLIDRALDSALPRPGAASAPLPGRIDVPIEKIPITSVFCYFTTRAEELPDQARELMEVGIPADQIAWFVDGRPHDTAKVANRQARSILVQTGPAGPDFTLPLEAYEGFVEAQVHHPETYTFSGYQECVRCATERATRAKKTEVAAILTKSTLVSNPRYLETVEVCIRGALAGKPEFGELASHYRPAQLKQALSDPRRLQEIASDDKVIGFLVQAMQELLEFELAGASSPSPSPPSAPPQTSRSKLSKNQKLAQDNARDWWASTQRGSACCDRCSGDIARGTGFLVRHSMDARIPSSADLVCDRCWNADDIPFNFRKGR